MQTLDPTIPYFISPVSQSSRFITVDGLSNLILTPQGTNSSALAFYVKISAANASRDNICTNYSRGIFCLDQWGNNVTRAALQRSILDTGQLWTLTPITTSNATTFWRLQSDFGGSRYLTAQDDDIYMLDDAPVNETYWQFINFSQVSTSTTASSTAISTSSSIPTSIIPSATFTPSPLATSRPHGSSHPIGVIVGATIAGVGAILIAILAVLFMLWRRKKAKAREAEASEQPVSEQKYFDPFSKSQEASQTRTYQINPPGIYEAPPSQPPVRPATFYELGGREVPNELGHERTS